MKQTKVTSVFDGIEMQKYFLYMTKQAEEAAHRAFMETLDMQVSIDEFLSHVKDEPNLKLLIQDLLLSSITNIDWDQSINHLLLENY